MISTPFWFMMPDEKGGTMDIKQKIVEMSELQPHPDCA
jgi:hypothetical protein